MYAAAKRNVKNLVHKANYIYFNREITECKNCKQLDTVTDKLPGRTKSTFHHPTTYIDNPPVKIAKHFHKKQSLETNLIKLFKSINDHTTRFCQLPFTTFYPVSITDARTCAPKCCVYDRVPTTLLLRHLLHLP